MKKTWLYSITGIVIALILIVLANYALNFARGRIDLTDGDIYTLSDGTRKLLRNLKEPVKIKYYFNRSDETVPIQLRVFGQRVDDFLNEYKAIAGDKVVIERLNPTPDSDAEDQATVDGVESQQLMTGDKFYLGLALSQGERKAVLPTLIAERERLLEYDLTRAIARVTTATKPVLGVMSPLGLEGDRFMAMRGQPMVPQTFYSELQQNYDVKRIELSSESIPEEIKTLLVVHPRGISDQTQYALDQFVLRGGRLIAFVDPHAYFDQIPLPGMPPQGGTSSSLDKLFKAWGIGMDNAKVILDLENAAGAGQRMIPTVLALDGPALNKDDVSTSMMSNALVPMAGAFTGKPIEGLKQTVLIKSSRQAQLVEGQGSDKQGPEAIRNFKAGGEELPIAIKLTGKFKTAFPDGKPKPEEKKDDAAKKDEKPAAKAAEKPKAPDAPQLKEAKDDNTVVLVADSDLINDGAAVQIREFFGRRIAIPANGNLTFLTSVVEQMAGDPALIALGAKAVSNRPLTVVKQIEAEAQQAYLGKLKALEDNLNATKEKLSALQKTKPEAGAPPGAEKAVLTPEQQAEVDRFRKQVVETRRELKDVRRDLRADVSALEFWTKVVNIGLMPLLVAIAGIILALVKRRRQAAALRESLAG